MALEALDRRMASKPTASSGGGAANAPSPVPTPELAGGDVKNSGDIGAQTESDNKV